MLDSFSMEEIETVIVNADGILLMNPFLNIGEFLISPILKFAIRLKLFSMQKVLTSYLSS
jgi:hypothetical protein